MLTIYNALPEGILELGAKRLYEVLPGPALIHITGQRKDVLFISVLLHGNEDSGWEAIRSVLKKYQGDLLPRSVCLYIGNVDAAREGLRHLPQQQDYNRVWKGEGESAEHCMAREVLEELRKLDLFAGIDVHNNTGKNPHYACVNRLEQDYLHLATLYSRTVVYFLKPDGVMSMALSALCPAVTIECGKPGDSHGVLHVIEYIEAGLHLAEFPSHPVAVHDLDLFHTVATVKVPDHISIGIEDTTADIDLLPEIDRLNFNELPVGTMLGYVRNNHEPSLQAWDEMGNEVSARYFSIREGEIVTTIPLMPSMLTLDQSIIKQDCLCYLMERFPLK